MDLKELQALVGKQRETALKRSRAYADHKKNSGYARVSAFVPEGAVAAVKAAIKEAVDIYLKSKGAAPSPPPDKDPEDEA